MIVDDIDNTLCELRAEAESMMTLTVQAYQPGIITDGEGIKVPGPVPFGDPCCAKAQGGSAATRDPGTDYVTIGGVERPVLIGGLHLPVGAYVVNGRLQIVASRADGVGWEFKVLGVGSKDDPGLLNRRYKVINVPAKSRATARRLDVVEL